MLIAALLGLGLSENRRAIQKRADETGEVLANIVFGSIIGPMAIGDGDTIRRQMEDFRSGMHGVDVAVFGFDRTITYASEKTTLGAELGRHLSSAELSGAVVQLLKTGRVAQHSFELEKYAMPAPPPDFSGADLPCPSRSFECHCLLQPRWRMGYYLDRQPGGQIIGV